MPRELETQRSIDGMLIRGGTSKGLFVEEGELPPPGDVRDELVLELFGTPDPLQLDGVGGTHSHTSKVMIVSESSRADADVDYTFGQVGVETPVVDYSGNCGNLTSAVGAFALLRGLVAPVEPTTELTLFNTNTNAYVRQTIPVEDGEPAVTGGYAIDGVPGTGARIDSHFQSPGGEVLGGSILPTGRPAERVEVDGAEVRLSVVDAVNLCVFVRADDLGLSGSELPAEIAGREGVLQRLELIRGTICEGLGLVDDARDAAMVRPATPLVCVVAEPRSYETSVGGRVSEADVDVTSRMISSQSPHHAYPVTGAMCLAAATKLPGSVPNEVVPEPRSIDAVTIGHPKGTISIGVTRNAGGDDPPADGEGPIGRVSVGRTARAIMSGKVYYHETRTG